MSKTPTNPEGMQRPPSKSAFEEIKEGLEDAIGLNNSDNKDNEYRDMDISKPSKSAVDEAVEVIKKIACYNMDWTDDDAEVMYNIAKTFLQKIEKGE